MAAYSPDHPPTSPTEDPGVTGTAYRCSRCGFDLSGTPIGGSCPECGQPVGETLQSGNLAKPKVPNAVACLVLGILSIMACGLLGPIAIVLYHGARNQVQSGFYDPDSMGMAKAGMILGWVGTALAVLQCAGFALVALNG